MAVAATTTAKTKSQAFMAALLGCASVIFAGMVLTHPMPRRRYSGSRLIQIVLRTIAAASFDGDHALLLGRESAIGAGAVGEIRAPRIILRQRARPDRRRRDDNRQDRQPPRHAAAVTNFAGHGA